MNTEARLPILACFFRLADCKMSHYTDTYTHTHNWFCNSTLNIFFSAWHCTTEKLAHLQHINPINGQLNRRHSQPQTGCTQQSLAPRNPPWVTGMSGTKRIPFLNGVFGRTDIMQPLRHRSCHPCARDCAHYADVLGSWFFAGAPPRRIACLPSTWLQSPAGSVPWQSVCLPGSVGFLRLCLLCPSSPSLTKLCFVFVVFRPSGWMFSLLSPVKEKTSHTIAQPAQVFSKQKSARHLCSCVWFALTFTPELSITITKAKLLLAFVWQTLWKLFGQLTGIALMV